MLFVGCGKGDNHKHDHANEDGGSRPASKLAEVKADEAWKTPLNLARFSLQQVKEKRWLNKRLHELVGALVKSGQLEQAFAKQLVKAIQGD